MSDNCIVGDNGASGEGSLNGNFNEMAMMNGMVRHRSRTSFRRYGFRRPPIGSPLGTRSGTVLSKSGSSNARRNAMRSC